MHDPCSSPDLITLEQALDYILSACPPNLFYERLAIRSTRQRLTFEPVYAAINVPSFRNSAMDGYALQHNDQQQTSLKLVGCSWAGRPYKGAVAKGECVRIFTGAYVPDDCDCVVMQENVTPNSDSITINSWPTPFENVRDIASDIKQGNIIVDKGKLIKPADIGLLASCGVADIAVYKKLTVGFFSTGDELISIGQQPLLGEIFDSNRYTLHALLEEAGVTALDLGVIPDNFSAVEEALLSASQLCDVIITTGGVSVGDADFITDVLKKIGRVELWKIAIKPGKPLAFG
ncbi:MAG: molybdopterin molybdotransferase MoeA, partial [Cycloclasticus sp.]|nr:molybdopterin molybdotransferase MoeA [Cycloclasticus sp.]